MGSTPGTGHRKLAVHAVSPCIIGELRVAGLSPRAAACTLTRFSQDLQPRAVGVDIKRPVRFPPPVLVLP
jgi:hypothetical protein